MLSKISIDKKWSNGSSDIELNIYYGPIYCAFQFVVDDSDIKWVRGDDQSFLSVYTREGYKITCGDHVGRDEPILKIRDCEVTSFNMVDIPDYKTALEIIGALTCKNSAKLEVSLDA